MGFLGRIFGKPSQPDLPVWPPPGPIASWPGEPLRLSGEVSVKIFDPPRKPIDVVGESYHESVLNRVAGGRTVDGARLKDHLALLMPEPSNMYDAQAVRVVISTGGTVGYLSHENAVAYRPLIDRLAAVGKLAAARASISGGWDNGDGDRGNFGVRLFLDTPEGAAKELEADPEGLRPAWVLEA